MIASMEIVNEPVIAESPRRHVLYQHHRATEAEIAATVGRAFEALYGRAAQAGVVPAGPPFAVYHNEPEPGEPFEMYICVGVSAPISPSPDIEFIELPATRVVSLLHIGPYDTLGRAYEAVKTYIGEHDLKPTAPPREFYLSPPDVPPEQVQTLVEFPIG
jgi:effector-binding domain-containing protein